MAITIIGKSTCAICGRIFSPGEKLMGFGPIFQNEQEALFFFNDGVFHEQCVVTHPLGPSALGRLDEFKRHTGPGKRRCFICGREVRDPDDYTGLAHLTEEADEPLYHYNYAHFHRSCFRSWSKRDELLALLERFSQSGNWKGKALKALLDDLVR